MTLRLVALAAAMMIAVPMQAQNADPAQFKPLPERNDVVSWKLFAKVEQDGTDIRRTLIYSLNGGDAAASQTAVAAGTLSVDLSAATVDILRTRSNGNAHHDVEIGMLSLYDANVDITSGAVIENFFVRTGAAWTGTLDPASPAAVYDQIFRGAGDAAYWGGFIAAGSDIANV